MTTIQELNTYIALQHSEITKRAKLLGEALPQRFAMDPKTTPLAKLQEADTYLASLQAWLAEDTKQLGDGMLARYLLELPSYPSNVTPPPPPPPAGGWPDPKTFDDGSVGGKIPAGMTLFELAGGYYPSDGGKFIDLQGHVEHDYNQPAPWGPTYKGRFFRGKIMPGVPMPKGIGEHLTQAKWFRAYDVEGLIIDGCVFFRVGKFLAGAHEGHGNYYNAYGDVTILNTTYYQNGANGVQIDWRGGCLDPKQGWYPETLVAAPKEFVSAKTGFLGRGLPTKTIRLANVAIIECGKIRSGAPFPVEVSRDGYDLSLFAPGQMVDVANLYMREIQGLPFKKDDKADGVECRSSVGFLHQDVRRAYPRSAPFVHINGYKAEGFLNDRTMGQWGDADEVLATGLDLVDHGGREVVVALESTVKHAVVENVGAPFALELRDYKDPHRSVPGLRKTLGPGDRWVGDPSKMTI